MKYPIQPSDISTESLHPWGKFYESTYDISAKYLIRMAQKNGDWRNFTEKDIETFSNNQCCLDYFIDQNQTLASTPFIKKNRDGSFSFTHKFISAYFNAAPTTYMVEK